MRWRTVGGEPSGEETARPDLTAVLEHYGVILVGRSTQMVKCPFHDDRTPSCSVNLSTGLFNCHSCGRGGDSYRLIEQKEGLDFRGARRFAAAQHFAEGDAGGSNSGVSGNTGSGRWRSAVSPGQGNRTGGGYVPSFRRGR